MGGVKWWEVRHEKRFSACAVLHRIQEDAAREMKCTANRSAPRFGVAGAALVALTVTKFLLARSPLCWHDLQATRLFTVISLLPRMPSRNIRGTMIHARRIPRALEAYQEKFGS